MQEMRLQGFLHPTSCFKLETLFGSFFVLPIFFISLAILVMAQVRTILLAFFMAVALYVYYNSSPSSIKNAIKGFLVLEIY
jgi:hypothetical protein